MNDKHTTPITTDLPAARKSSLLVRLSVLIGVLGIGVGLLWWQKANEPPAPKPSEIELAMRNAVAGWERTQRSLQEELATHRPATEAYLKQRQERLLAGQFELPLDAMSNPQLQMATANFRRRDTEVYRQHSTDAGAARDAAIAFLDEYFHELEKATPEEERQSTELGRGAYQAGARDPVFLVYHVIGEFIQGDTSPVLVTRMESALEQLNASGVSPMAKFIGHRWLAGLSAQERIDRRQARGLAAIEALKQFAVTATDDPLEPRVKSEQLRQLYKDLEPPLRRAMITALVETPGVDPWLRQYWAGLLAIDEGWKIRGTGYANTVNESQWKQFHEHIERAGQHLRCAWALHPTFPEAPARLVTVAKAGVDRPPGRFWFFEAAWAQPDYYSAYTLYLEDLQPRWGGSHEQMIAFGRQCLQTGRYDLGVPQYLLLVMKKIEDDLESSTEDKTQCVAVEGVVPALKRLLVEMQQKRNASGQSLLAKAQPAERSSLAKYLTLAGDYTSAGAVLDASGDLHDDTHYESIEISATAQRGWIRGMAGPHAAEFRQLKDDLIAMCFEPETGPQPDELVTRTAALRALDPSPATGAFLEFVETRLAQRRAFDRGEWVPLNFLAKDELWWFWTDWRQCPSENVAEFGSRGDGHGVQIALRMRFPIPYEIEASIDQLTGRALDTPAGLLIGKNRGIDGDSSKPRVLVALADHGGRLPMEGLELFEIEANPGIPRRNPTVFTVARRPNQRLGMLVWPKTFEVVFAGESIEPPANVLASYVASDEIAIGWWLPNKRARAQHLRVSSPRIRKLPYGPPPPATASFEEQLAYFDNVVRVHPDHPRAHRRLAYVWRGRDPEKSHQHANRALELDPRVTDIHTLRAEEHLLRSEYAEALREYEAELLVSSLDYRVRVWLAKLLCAVPDDALRDPRRAATLHAETERLSNALQPAEGKYFPYVRPMLLAEQGKFDAALQALDLLEPLAATEASELQWVAQQRAAFSERKPFRFQPLVFPKLKPLDETVPSALAPENGSTPTPEPDRK